MSFSSSAGREMSEDLFLYTAVNSLSQSPECFLKPRNHELDLDIIHIQANFSALSPPFFQEQWRHIAFSNSPAVDPLSSSPIQNADPVSNSWEQCPHLHSALFS